MNDGKVFITDNGNYIVDLHIGNPMDVNEVYYKVNGITGVLETGLFINMCKIIIVGTDNGAKVIENK